jgi:queuine tRNA-ribosyltransferase
MPAGTTVKQSSSKRAQNDINPDIVLGIRTISNLRPQTAILEQAGGLHKFMNWDRNILTDSGGYQVYSLSAEN